MSLRSRLILAFLAVVSLLIVVGVTSFYIEHRIQAQVADLRPNRGADLRGIDIRNISLEIKGFWDPIGTFIATDVEALPGTRRPKLRGEIQSVDLTQRSVTLYGVPIHVVDETEFIDASANDARFEALRPGQRIEVSCRVVEGRWTARKIKTRNVKSSDKIKGTPTAAEIDGAAPETVELEGLMVSLAPPKHETPGSALRHVEVATRMTLVLQESRVAAHELVGRTLVWHDPDGTRELDRDTRPSIAADETLTRAERDFEYYVGQARMWERQIAGPSLPTRFAPWLRSLSEKRASFGQHVTTLQKLARGDADRARPFLDEVFDPFLQDELLPSVYAYRGEAEEALAEQVHAISSHIDTMTRMALATSAVAVIVAIVLGVLTWRSIHIPIRALTAAAIRLGQGHLATRVDVRSRDELGVLADTFNKMAEDLAATTVSVSNLENVFDSMAGALIIFDSDGRITNVNRAALRLIGRGRGDLLGCPFEKICPPPRAESAHPIIETTDDGIVAIEERVFLRSDGSHVPVSFSGAELRSQHGPLQGYVCVAQDLTERKRIEERLRDSLAEKELLLREVHHRVKNNMQVISSLLAIQSSYATDPDTIEKFEQSQRRIQSMALIHEQLYQTRSFGDLDLRAYLERLTGNLLQSFDGCGHVTLDLQVEDLSSDVDRALACGLIVNELVTNSIKHAFPNGAAGEIRVSLSQDGTGDQVLLVADDGCGMPDDFALDPSPTLGLSLAVNLVRQFNGDISFGGSQGTEVRVVLRRGVTGGGVAS